MLSSTLGYRTSQSLFSLEWGHLHQGQWADYTLLLSEGVLGIPGLLPTLLLSSWCLSSLTLFRNSRGSVCDPLNNMPIWAGISKAKRNLLQEVWRQQKAGFLRLDFVFFPSWRTITVISYAMGHPGIKGLTALWFTDPHPNKRDKARIHLEWYIRGCEGTGLRQLNSVNSKM